MSFVYLYTQSLTHQSTWSLLVFFVSDNLSEPFQSPLIITTSLLSSSSLPPTSCPKHHILDSQDGLTKQSVYTYWWMSTRSVSLTHDPP